jgi:hypothetical protein
MQTILEMPRALVKAATFGIFPRANAIPPIVPILGRDQSKSKRKTTRKGKKKRKRRIKKRWRIRGREAKQMKRSKANEGMSLTQSIDIKLFINLAGDFAQRDATKWNGREDKIREEA